MSKATLYVRFPDGTVRYGIYNGTADNAWGRLFETADEALGLRWVEGVDWYPDPDGEVTPVEIATDYGGGSNWTGIAARNTLTDGFDALDAPDWRGDLPPWVTPCPPV